jgi:hypothetical protein
MLYCAVRLCLGIPGICTCHQKFMFHDSCRTILAYYAAEAYCRLGDLRQAEKFFQPEFVIVTGTRSDTEETWLNSININAACERSYSWSKVAKKTEMTAFEAVQICNRAAVLCCQGLLNDALHFVSQVLDRNAKFYPAIRILVYIHLRIGNRSNAIAALQKFGVKLP